MKTNLFKLISINTVRLWLLIFCAAPILLILSLCVFTNSDSSLFALPLTLSNFKLLSMPFFYNIVSRSLVIAFLATALCFVIAYPFSYFLSQAKHKNLLLLFVLIPFWTSALIRIYALIGLLKAHGLINAFLISMHLINNPIEMIYNQASVVIGLSYNLLPFMILPLYNFFNKFDHALIAAAKDLNVSNTYIFKTIIWPLSLPTVKNSVLMIFFPAMTTFYIPTILGGAHSMLIGNLIENQFLLLNDWPSGATTSVIIIIFMFLCLKKFNAKGSIYE